MLKMMQSGVEGATRILSSTKLDYMPHEIIELQALLQQPEPNLNAVVDLLGHNPEIMGEFLSLVNKVHNRAQDDLVLDLHSAVHIMGLDEIEQLFISAYLMKTLPVGHTDKKILKHSMRAGIASAELSHWVYDLARCEAYLCSFMQDLGALYMIKYDAEAFIDRYFNHQLESPIQQYQMELEHYQTTHAFVGAVITKRWHLGELLSKFLVLHHQSDLQQLKGYNPRVAKMVAVNHLANYLVYKVFSDHYMTSELEYLFKKAKSFLEMSDQAVHAAESALEKWGNSEVGLHSSSH